MTDRETMSRIQQELRGARGMVMGAVFGVTFWIITLSLLLILGTRNWPR